MKLTHEMSWMSNVPQTIGNEHGRRVGVTSFLPKWSRIVTIQRH
jgi:hypothetical protein